MAEFPRDWEHVSVKSLMDLQCGFPFKSTFFNSKGNGIRIVKNRDLKTDDQVFFTTEQVSDEYIIRDGDILIGMDGDFLPCRWKKGIALLNQRVGRLIVTKRIDRDFAYYVLQEPLDELQQATSATTVKHLSPSAFGNLFVTVPSEVAEQHRIADALGSIDKLIDNLTRRIEKKRLVKQGVMQELLTGKKRLPGCKGKWRNITIGELGELTGSGVDKKFVNGETPVRLVNYVDVFHRDFLWNRDLHFWTTADSKKHNLCNVLKGDVFFTPSSEMPHDIALSAVAMEDMENVCYSYHVYRLRFSQDIALAFRSYMFKTEAFYQQANRACDGSGTRYVITLPKFRRMSVSIPNDYAEQQAIAQVLGNMDTEIAKLEAKRDKYIDIKRGVMNDLLTGKVRM